jgi:hypothetical protein
MKCEYGPGLVLHSKKNYSGRRADEWQTRFECRGSLNNPADQMQVLAIG